MPGEFPNDENGQVLFKLQSRGDDLSTPREINFHFVFPTRNQALGFIELIADKNVRLELSWYAEEEKWQCTAVKVMVPQHDEISRFEARFADLAEPLQGVPDGWDCIVIKAEN